ncbi:hypothetical protein [Croceitalea dokdonensis]|nr:hypothetical protein [Croceitalea dokdonensis]
MHTSKSLRCLFMTLCLGFNGLAQSNDPIKIPFTTTNGFTGQATFEFSYALENFYKLRIDIKEVQITQLTTSLGEFSKDDLNAEGITFPFDCADCSLQIKGTTSGPTLPFEFDTKVSPNHIVTVKMSSPVPEEEEAYQKAKRDWEKNTVISNIDVLIADGTELNKAISAVKRYGQRTVDQEKMDRLLEELATVPQSEWKGKIYANRSSFYDKKRPDSLLLAVREGRFTPISSKTNMPKSNGTLPLNPNQDQMEAIPEAKETTTHSGNCEQQLAALEARKKNALADEDYLAAASFKALIQDIKEGCNAKENSQEPIMDATVRVTELKVPAMVEEEQELQESQTMTTHPTENPTAVSDVTQEKTPSLSTLIGGKTEDSTLAQLTEHPDKDTKENPSALSAIVSNVPKKNSKKAKKLGKSDFEFSSDLSKYKRSSLHSMMIQNPGAEQAEVIQQTFLERPLPEKFNTHHIPKNFIRVARKARKQDKVITDYLNRNAVARELVAKWFNRNERGEFNMDLIAERGHYNATVFDVNIAKKSERGLAMLADAGEQLISNTFVIVTDYKYTNKEVVAKKTGFLSSMVSAAANMAGAGDVALVADAVTVGTAIAGKGYIVKATSYLYRLVWNERIANTFYNEMWVDENNFDDSKKRAFDTTDLFQLALIGYETDWSDVQSSAFTNKSDAELIQRATIKATDQAIAKLQRKYEIFRTKTPLISTEPLAAKIGLKEGLEKGDKFEVLEQYLQKDGSVGYKKVGVIKVDKYHIWDNRYAAAEENPSSLEYTTFSGAKNKYYQGMLIRQIN